MDNERNEVYERIPWETLEKRGVDRQWLYIGLAAAIALGALAYSFMKNQPVEAPSSPEAVAATTATVVTTPPGTVPSTVASPLVVAEADLYAVEPERLIDAAVAHAEWFAVEYFSVDGSELSRNTITSLLPSGIPAPEAPADTQVFVDWAGAQRISEVAPFTYEVDVVVRSLVSRGEDGFVRQPPRMIRVELRVGEDGTPYVSGAPVRLEAPTSAPAPVSLQAVPADLEAQFGDVGSIVGGLQEADGGWRVVAMVEDADGVIRPTTVQMPARSMP